ncbi:MAG: hypothetical protein DRG78_12100 [Epsilonproteobacteria bacterium]|nr:MAG: hypothetical protein DRG78_12100 [Campylobacterota bacterium]
MNKINYTKIYYYSILIFAFILPLSRAGISFFVTILPLIYLIEGDFKNKYNKIKSNKILIALGIYIVYSALTILWSTDIEMALHIIRLNLYLLTIFVIATSLKKEYIYHIITIFLVGMFVSEFIAYGVFFELWQFKYATPVNPSPFMMHMDYSVFMAFTSILLLNRILSSHYNLKEKLVFGFFFLTVTGNLFLATGRTGQVAFIAGIIIMTILHFRVSIKSFILSIILLTTIFTTAYNISDSFKMRVGHTVADIEKMKDGDFSGSWGIRVAYWIVTYNIIQEYPLGVGIGDFELVINEELKKDQYMFFSNGTKYFMCNNHPHNQFLVILLQMGAIGIVLFLYFIYQILAIKIEDKELKNLSVIFMIIYLVGCFGEPLMLKQFTLTLFALFIGLFLSYNNEKLKEL